MQDRGLEGSDEMARGMQMQDRRMKPQAEQPQKCPRCDSLNTKFCYYNNYSLSQPRYFCKTCRRYWTKGGTLRNVPVGGGCRKGKRSKRGGSSDNHHPVPIPIPSSFRDQEAIATTSSPGMMVVGTVGEDSPGTPASVYYTGDHGGFSGYNSGPRLQLHMVDQQAGSSGAGDNNKLSIFPSLATLQSFNHPTINLVDFSCIFDPRGHHHQLPTSTPTETFQSPSAFNLPVVQGVVNNGPDQWRLQQEHIKFSPVAAATGRQQQPPLDPHIGRDGPLHLLPADGNVIQGLKRDQPKLGHHAHTTGATPCSSVKHEETTGGSYQDWQVPSHSLIENPTNTDHGETAASGYWNNGCSSGPSPRWPDLSGFGHPPSSFL